MSGDRTGKAFVKLFRRSCGRAECPVCYEKWGSKEAHRATRRLSFYKGAFSRAIHVVAAPSLDVVESVKDYEELRALAERALRATGVRGGCMIYHPWRENDDGTWRFSPHFHVVGFGWVVDTADYSKRGWVVRNVGLRKSVYATIMYQLSHAGVYVGKRPSGGILPIAKSKKFCTVTWFGCCSYTKLRVPKLEREPECCPLCKAPLVSCVWIGDGDPPLGGEGASFWVDSESWIVTENAR